MKRLTPSMCQVPSGCWTALVRPAPTSEPASGSVSTIVAPQLLVDHQLGDLALLLGAEPVDHVGEGRPEAYMCTAGLEPSTSSATAQRSCGGHDGAAQLLGQVEPPPLGVHVGLEGLLEPLGHRDRCWSPGRRPAGCGRTSSSDSASSSVGQPLDLARMLRAVSSSTSAYGPVPRTCWRPKHLEQVELDVAQVALVVAHRVRPFRYAGSSSRACYSSVTTMMLLASNVSQEEHPECPGRPRSQAPSAPQRPSTGALRLGCNRLAGAATPAATRRAQPTATGRSTRA